MKICNPVAAVRQLLRDVPALAEPLAEACLQSLLRSDQAAVQRLLETYVARLSSYTLYDDALHCDRAYDDSTLVFVSKGGRNYGTR